MADPNLAAEKAEYQRYLSHSALRLMKDYFSETTWQACWRSVVQQQAARQIAQDLGLSVNAVYLARGRVLKRLRDELHGLWES